MKHIATMAWVIATLVLWLLAMDHPLSGAQQEVIDPFVQATRRLEMLDERRINGEPFTPEFMETLYAARRDVAMLQLDRAQAKAEKNAIGEGFLRSVDATFHPLTFDGDGGDRYFAWRQYFLADARRLFVSIETNPQTVAAAHKDLTDKTANVFALIDRQHRSGADLTICFVDRYGRWSHRLALAEFQSAKEPPAKVTACDAHLGRMQRLREELHENKSQHQPSVFLSAMVDVVAEAYLAEAHQMLADARRSR